MKKLTNVVIIVLLLSILGNITVHAQDVDSLKTLLLETGVEEPYNSNIIDYLKSNVVSKTDLVAAIDLTRNSIKIISAKGGIAELTFNECYYIYNNVMIICNCLNFKIHINFINFKFSIIDRLSGNVIFQGNLINLNEYSIIFETLISNNEFITELIT